ISVLRAYLPQAFSDSKIEHLVDEVIASIEAKGQQELGKVIAVLKPRLAGRADMGKVVALVRTKLTS
ncbi:MAG: GatB/YqeY domain-containing protein, partial [Nitrosomonadaceae bacterium]